MGPDQLKEVQTQIQFLLAKKYIRPSKSPYGAPVLFAPKKDGGWRMAIDYRQLNKQTVDDNYGIPKISDVFDQMASQGIGDEAKRSQYFSCIDLVWAFWQIKVGESSVEKTAIVTPLGSYEFLVCPFGLKQMPSLFQRIIETVLRPYLTRFCMVYLDDIIIYSATAEEHMTHLTLVFEALEKANFHIKLEKCLFFQKNVPILGWIVGRDGRKIDPKKTKAITEWKKPETYPQLARFLGAVGHVRDVIPNCAGLTAPLSEATKGQDIRKALEKQPNPPPPIQWTPQMETAFEDLKKALVSPPVLQLVDTTKEFWLKCDASDKVIGACLMQNFDGKLHPVAYHSRKLSDVEFKWHIIEKEALSCVEPLKRWDKYFSSAAEVHVLGDSSPVAALLVMKNPKPKHLRWILELQTINLDYTHIAGHKNVFADAMTRTEFVNMVFEQSLKESLLKEVFIEEDDFRKYSESCWFLQGVIYQAIEATVDSAPNPELLTESGEVAPLTPLLVLGDWLKNIKASYATDDMAQRILQGIKNVETYNYKVVDGHIFHFPAQQTECRSLYVPNNIFLRQSIIEAHHGTVYSQHLDKKRTFEKIKRHFYWPSMEEDVHQFLASCDSCLRGKYRTTPKPAISIPMDIPQAPWLLIGMDGKTGMPRTKLGHDMFWIVVDYFTGKFHIIPDKKSGTSSEKLAYQFLREVYRHHGLPLKIVTDRDPLFTSAFWTEFWKQLTVILNLSTARNPWTDGKSERYIRTVTELMRTFCLENPMDWDILSPALEFAVNDTMDPVRGITPFQADTLGEPHSPIALLMKTFKQQHLNIYDANEKDPHYFSNRFSQVQKDISERMIKIGIQRRRLLAKRGYIGYDFRKGDKVMIENPAAQMNWKRLSVFEPRYVGPFTLGDEIRPNQYVVEEWKTHGRKHFVVNGSKFKPVAPKLTTFEEPPIEPEPPIAPAVPVQNPVAQPQAPPQPPAHLVPAADIYPLVQSVQVISSLESGDVHEKDKLDFNHNVFELQFTVKTASDSSLKVLLRDAFEVTHLFYVAIISWLNGNTSDLQKLQVEARLKALNELNRYNALDPNYATHKKQVSTYLQRADCCPLGERVVSTPPSTAPLIGICSIWDPLYYSLPIFISWNDGDSEDLTRTEFRRLPSFVLQVNMSYAIQLQEIDTTLCNMETTTNCLNLLRTLMPGDWKTAHATKLVNRQLGGKDFNPMFISTNALEVQKLIRCLRVRNLQDKPGIDPFCGNMDIAQVFADCGIVDIIGNDINPLLKDATNENALNISTYLRWKGKFYFAVTSPPFDMLDIAVPLMASTFPISFIHVPAWYTTDMNESRHNWLSQLAQDGRARVLCVTRSRNTLLGHYCIWLVITDRPDRFDEVISIPADVHQLPFYV
jgi:hypothetical protein